MAKLTQLPVFHSRWLANLGDHVIAVAWSPKGSQVAAAGIHGPITLFDAKTGAVQHVLAGHGFGTTAIAWQPGGNCLASTGQDGKVRLWDTVTGSAIASLEGGAAWVEQLAWHPRGNCLVSAAGKKLRLWDATGTLLRSYPDQPATVAAIAWAGNGKEFVTGGYGGVTFWSPDNETASKRFAWSGSVLALAYSPDRRFIAGGGQDASVHFWYVKTGKDLEMTGYPQKVRELSWDASSRFLATGGGNLVTVWDCAEKGPAGSKPIAFELHAKPLSVVAFQRSGSLLASACSAGLIALWYPGVRKSILAQMQWTTGVSQMAWSPTDNQLLVGGDDGSVTVVSV